MPKNVHHLFQSEAPGLWASTVLCSDSDVGPEYPVLHQQVLDIIEKILSDPEPEHSEVRRRLLQHLAENPGSPEQALLDHLRDRSKRRGRRIPLKPKHPGTA